MASEFGLIRKIRKLLPSALQGRLGIGDDADILPGLLARDAVISTDAIVEGIDFRFREAKPEWVGRKALAVNLSDCAAMGAVPVGFTLALGVPQSMSEAWILKFYRGLLPLIKTHRLRFLGGDISKSATFFAAVTVIGKPGSAGCITRRGAQTGDWIGVTGVLGGSLLGHHFHFEPRIHEALFLAPYIQGHALMDISDGLAQDLMHILRASGKAACLEMQAIPVSDAAIQLSSGRAKNALHRALTDGEDFELLFTVADAQKAAMDRAWKRKFPKLRLSWIGRVQAGKPRISWLNQGRITRNPGFSLKGFEHFS